jgi:hypothetical protein
MKYLLIALFGGGLLCSCANEAETDSDVIKLPPQDSAAVIDHTRNADTATLKNNTAKDSTFKTIAD